MVKNNRVIQKLPGHQTQHSALSTVQQISLPKPWDGIKGKEI